MFVIKNFTNFTGWLENILNQELEIRISNFRAKILYEREHEGKFQICISVPLNIEIQTDLITIKGCSPEAAIGGLP